MTDISQGSDGQLWIARYNGASGFDGQRWTHIHDSTLHYDGKTDYLHVRSILADSKGRLWIGNNGIGVLLREKGSTSNFSKAQGLYRGTPMRYPAAPGTLMHVFAIAEDQQGNIWFGDRDTGAWRFDGRAMQNFIVDPALSSQHVWDIYEDREGALLVAMAAGGVYRFDGQGFVRKF